MNFVKTVLDAKSWHEIGYPHNKVGLRKAQSRVHPDICHEHGANDAFIKLSELFNQPDIDLRIAVGRYGNGQVQWDFKSSDYDLRDNALKLQKKIWESSDTVKWVPKPFIKDDALISEYGDGWWFLSSFNNLDTRTSAWVWRRLLAAISVAEKCGYVHGDINPKTVAIHPVEHGLRLDGWWSGVEVGDNLKVSPFASTAPGYLAGNAVNTALSVSQAASLMLSYDNAHTLRERLLEWRLRPVEVREAFEVSEDAITKDFGKRQWHVLNSPVLKSI